LSIPVKGGTKVLIAAGRQFEEDGIILDDLRIRRPSLDDVFLALTGSASTSRAVDEAADAQSAHS
jgi:ABC-2 type transport system ATP-binding protein